MTVRAVKGALTLVGEGKIEKEVCYPSVVDIGTESLRGLCFSEHLANYLNPGEVEGIGIADKLIVAVKRTDCRLIEEPGFTGGAFTIGNWTVWLIFSGALAFLPAACAGVMSDRRNEHAAATITWTVVMLLLIAGKH